MRLLLDTHTWIWESTIPDRLSRDAYQAIIDARSVLVSAISLWEVSMAVSKKRFDPVVPLGEWFQEALSDRELVPITPELAEICSKLQMHGDPGDRVILATAVHTETCLVSRDRALLEIASRHGVPVLEA